jgi:hypothetical protein
MTFHRYYPRHKTKSTLLTKLRSFGFFPTERTDDEGNTISTPEPELYEVSHANGHDAVWLGKPVLTQAVTDEDGNEISPAILSDLYCANVIAREPLNFGAIETNRPTQTVNEFAGYE